MPQLCRLLIAAQSDCRRYAEAPLDREPNLNGHRIFYVLYGKKAMSAPMLEVSIRGRTVLRPERDAWSMVK